VLAECVINVSEGRDRSAIDAVASSAGTTLLDLHSDPDHHRTVLTLGGPLDQVESSARSVVAAAVSTIDLTLHQGVHPRMGSVDVAPFVPLEGTMADAVGARDRLARWAGNELGLPCFLYGPERSLPEVRREAFHRLMPDAGPSVRHPTAGAMAVGARPLLVAYNLWIALPGAAAGDNPLPMAKAIASAVRGPSVRALGLAVGSGAQVSCNLVDPDAVGPSEIFDTVTRLAEDAGGVVQRAELVGLIPRSVLNAIPPQRWGVLNLGEDRTIERRLALDRTTTGDEFP
jgi:glutamate formiminotransferase